MTLMTNNWYITETSLDPATLRRQETIFTAGNGYLGTRGAFEEGYPGEQAMTLVHGVFDDIPIVHTELVNAPAWFDMAIFIGGEPVRLDRGTVLAYRRLLDLRTGVLTREVRWRSPRGRTVELIFERFASRAEKHTLVQRCQVTALDFAGPVEVRAGLPGHVDNEGYLHWEWDEQGAVGEQGVYLRLHTRATGITLALASQLRVDGAVYSLMDCPWRPTVTARAEVQFGQTLVAEKRTALYTSRDTEAPLEAARVQLARMAEQSYVALRAANDAAWESAWAECDVCIEGDDEADLAVRYSLFQLLSAAPQGDDHASIPAKSLSGPGYRGHVFWDTEIFMLPFFIYTQPHLAQAMLLYRYHTLAGARRKAQAAGCEGAMFAWESAATGDETTPRWVPVWDAVKGEETLIRIWCGDIELHITADVAYAVQHYWRITGDDAFMRDYGAELVLDTARFWGSRAQWNAARGVYEINDVIGPDENHDHVNNNAYTNGMVRWHLGFAQEVLAWLRQTAPERAAELTAALDLSAERLAHWRDVTARLHLAHDPQTHLIEQFDGFFQLQTLDFATYEPRTTSLQGLLGVEPTQRYQVLKQPDVLMLLYLLEPHYDAETLRANWDYYTPRTDLTYGSSLGPAIQAALAARLGDPAAAYRHFMLAARTDLQDARGNTAHGIHAATAGGLWQAVVFGFGGVRITEAGPAAEPHLPAGWQRLTFKLRYRGKTYAFDLKA